MRRVLFGFLTVLLLAGCGAQPSPQGVDSAGATEPPPVSRPLTDPEPFSLFTHCGIDEVHYRGEWYERIGGVLDDGNGNPPSGWDNPSHAGTMASIDDHTIVFTDDLGHQEHFTLREDATGPKNVCS